MQRTIALPDRVVQRAAPEPFIQLLEFAQPVLAVTAEEPDDREAVDKRYLPRHPGLGGVFQVDIRAGEVSRYVQQTHADQLTLQLGRTVERLQYSEIAGGACPRGRAGRKAGVERQQKDEYARGRAAIPQHPRAAGRAAAGELTSVAQPGAHHLG